MLTGESRCLTVLLHSVCKLLVSLLVLVNLLVDVTYASLDPRIPYQSLVCPTAHGANATEGFYEHTASPQDPRYESSRVSPGRLGGWRNAVRLASTPAPLWGAEAARLPWRHPAHTRVGSPHFDSHLTINNYTNYMLSFVYGRLVRHKTGADVQPGTLPIEPDLAERWEEPDDTTVVFHLRRE